MLLIKALVFLTRPGRYDHLIMVVQLDCYFLVLLGSGVEIVNVMPGELFVQLSLQLCWKIVFLILSDIWSSVFTTESL